MACGAARLGLTTALAAVTGDDLYGRFMIEALRERGVETDGVVVEPELQTGAHGDPGAARGPRDPHVPRGDRGAAQRDGRPATRCERARHVHVAAFFLQRALCRGLGALLASVRSARRHHLAGSELGPLAENGMEACSSCCPQVDVLLLNVAEVQAIAGVADAVGAARRLAEAGPLVVVKMGADGAVGGAGRRGGRARGRAGRRCDHRRHRRRRQLRRGFHRGTARARSRPRRRWLSRAHAEPCRCAPPAEPTCSPRAPKQTHSQRRPELRATA